MENKDQPDKVEQFCSSMVRDRIDQLKKLFPECLAEGEIDFEKLHEVLGEAIEEGPERYNFTWAGKRDAIRMLQAPSPSTLIPSREESVNFDAHSKSLYRRRQFGSVEAAVQALLWSHQDDLH